MAPSTIRNWSLRNTSIQASRAWLVAALLAVGVHMLGRGAPAARAQVDDSPPGEDKAATVEFQRDIGPILRSNCYACHSQSKAEGGVVLESVEAILAGGDNGPLLEVGKGTASRLYEVASRTSEPAMPPEDNDVGAKPLTEDQLRLLAAWIDQGAVAGSAQLRQITWRAVPPRVQPVYSVAMDRSATWVAGTHGNRATIYSLIDGHAVSELIDPAVAEKLGPQSHPAADLDFVQALVFSPDGQWLASGGFRTVKLWRREALALTWIDSEGSNTVSAWASLDAGSLVVGFADGRVERHDASKSGEPPSRQQLRQADGRLVSAIARIDDASLLLVLDGGARYQVCREQQCHPVHVGSRVGPVNSVVVGPEGAVVLLTSDQRLHAAHLAERDGAWVLEDRETGVPEGREQAVAVRVAADRQLLIASSDGRVTQHDWAGSSPQREMAHGQPLTGVTLSADGQRLVTWGTTGAAKLWNIADGNQLGELTGDAELRVAARQAAVRADVAADRVRLAEADLEEIKKQVDDADKNRKKAVEDRDKIKTELAAKAEELAKRQAEKAELAAQAEQGGMKIAADQQRVEAIGQELTALEAAVTELRERADASAEATDDPRRALLAEIQAKFAALAELSQGDSTVELLRRETERLDKRFVEEADQKRVEHKQLVDQLNQSLERQTTLVAERDQLNSGMEKLKAELEELKPKIEAKDKEVNQATSQHQELEARLAVSEQEIERTEKLWTETEALVAPANQLLSERQQASSEAQSARQAADATASASGAPVRGAAFWGADRVVLWSDTSEGRRLRVLSAADAQPLVTLQAPADIDPTGFLMLGDQLVAIGAERLAAIEMHPRWVLASTWGSADGESPFVDRVTALDFSPDSRLLAVGGGEPSRGGQLQIWDVAEGKMVREIPDAHSDTVLSVAFSPDGKLLASGGADRFARVFRVEDGAVNNVFEGHTHHVLTVAWQLNGRRLVTGSADTTAKVWDIVKGEQLKTITGFGMDVTRVRFVGAGAQFIASCGDRSISLCEIDGKRNVIRQLDDYVYAADIVPISDSIVAGSHSGAIVVIGTDGKDRRELP